MDDNQAPPAPRAPGAPPPPRVPLLLLQPFPPPPHPSAPQRPTTHSATVYTTPPCPLLLHPSKQRPAFTPRLRTPPSHTAFTHRLHTSPSHTAFTHRLHTLQIGAFTNELAKRGYVWQFITLAGFHCNGASSARTSRKSAIRPPRSPAHDHYHCHPTPTPDLNVPPLAAHCTQASACTTSPRPTPSAVWRPTTRWSR
jgi:hypothetical protein